MPSTGIPSRPGSSAPNSADIEKGSDGKTKQPQSEPESRVASAFKGSKWAAALGRDSSNISRDAEKKAHEVENALFDRDDHNLNLSRKTELVCKKSEHIQVVKDIRPPTQGNKWPRVATGGSVRHETIEETAEDEQKNKTGTETADSNKILVQPKSINSADYQQIVATLVDMRIDLKLEMQKLTNKIGKIDEHISNITKKLSTLNIDVDDHHSPSTDATATNLISGTSFSAQTKNSIKSFSTMGQNSTIEEVDEEAVTTPTSPRFSATLKRIDSSTSKIATATGKDHKGLATATISGQQQQRSSAHHRGKVSLVTAGVKKHGKSKSHHQPTSGDPSAGGGDDDDQKQQQKKLLADDDMRAILENEIAQQDLDNTDEDQDMTSKL